MNSSKFANEHQRQLFQRSRVFDSRVWLFRALTIANRLEYPVFHGKPVAIRSLTLTRKAQEVLSKVDVNK